MACQRSPLPRGGRVRRGTPATSGVGAATSRRPRLPSRPAVRKSSLIGASGHNPVWAQTGPKSTARQEPPARDGGEPRGRSGLSTLGDGVSGAPAVASTSRACRPLYVLPAKGRHLYHVRPPRPRSTPVVMGVIGQYAPYALKPDQNRKMVAAHCDRSAWPEATRWPSSPPVGRPALVLAQPGPVPRVDNEGLVIVAATE